MQRVSGLFGTGVLQADPTDQAAAANQRNNFDVWSAQQGYHWNRQASDQARQDALARLAQSQALAREQMGMQADLTREGWGRQDAASKAYYDYMGQRDQNQLGLLKQQRDWQLADLADQRAYDAPRREQEIEALKRQGEMGGQQFELLKMQLDQMRRAMQQQNEAQGAVGQVAPELQEAFNLAKAEGMNPAQALAEARRQARENADVTALPGATAADIGSTDYDREWYNPAAWGGDWGDESRIRATMQRVTPTLDAVKAAYAAAGLKGPRLASALTNWVNTKIPPTANNRMLLQAIYQHLGIGGGASTGPEVDPFTTSSSGAPLADFGG